MGGMLKTVQVPYHFLWNNIFINSIIILYNAFWAFLPPILPQLFLDLLPLTYILNFLNVR